MIFNDLHSYLSICICNADALSISIYNVLTYIKPHHRCWNSNLRVANAKMTGEPTYISIFKHLSIRICNADASSISIYNALTYIMPHHRCWHSNLRVTNTKGRELSKQINHPKLQKSKEINRLFSQISKQINFNKAKKFHLRLQMRMD